MSSGEDLDQDLMQSARLARLVRGAERLELTAATQTILKNLLLHQLGVGVAKPRIHQEQARAAPPADPRRVLRKPIEAAKPDAPLSRPVTNSKSSATNPVRAAATAAAATTADDSFGTSSISLEMKIRKLVEADAKWAQIEHLAWKLYALEPQEQVAAKIVELVFLYGEMEQVAAVLKRLRSLKSSFYLKIHTQVRAHLCLRLWRISEADVILNWLLDAKEHASLDPVEKLLIFMSICDMSDSSSPFMYFRRHRRDLFHAVREAGNVVGLTTAHFRLSVGKLAVSLGYEDDARHVLAAIEESDPLYEDALQLLLESRAQARRTGESHYTKQLLDSSSDDGRINLFARYVASTRDLGGFRDRNRPALNDLLAEPLQWLRRDSEKWKSMTRVLIENRDLEPLLPNILSLFKEHATIFLKPELDYALWSEFLNLHNAREPRDLYWIGVAKLHEYLIRGAQHEKLLWTAKLLVDRARIQMDAPLPYTWKELHRAAYEFVAKNTLLLEKDRGRLLLQMRIAAEPDSVTSDDVDRYLEEGDSHNLDVLDTLLQVAKTKRAKLLELNILRRRGVAAHLRNRDLERQWFLSAELSDHDLCWRIASILEARGALSSSVRHAWQISGEKRSQYLLSIPDHQQLDHALRYGFTQAQSRFAHAILRIGSMLPELIAALEPRARSMRLPASPSGSMEAKIDKLLSDRPFFQQRRRYVFPEDSLVGGSMQAPRFVRVVPQNPWANLFIKISERLGLNAWNWSLSGFLNHIADIIPKLANHNELRRSSAQVAKWLRTLDPEQRSAWQDLVSLGRKMSDEEAERVLASVVCRLATLFYQNHPMALSTLQAMRVPIVVLWDFECWLLSNDYSKIRKALGTANRVIVPQSLQRLGSILA